jgi:hypothetical protein
MELGGETAGLMPATPNEQGRTMTIYLLSCDHEALTHGLAQGRAFSRQYEAQKVDRNKWFRLTFHNSKG